MLITRTKLSTSSDSIVNLYTMFFVFNFGGKNTTLFSNYIEYPKRYSQKKAAILYSSFLKIII